MLDELQTVCHSLGILFDLDCITYFSTYLRSCLKIVKPTNLETTTAI